MKSLTVFVVLIGCALLTLGEDDGKYRPTEPPATTTILRTFPPTTRIPVYKYDEPRYGWRDSARQRPIDRYEPPRYEPPRYEPPRYDPRDSRFNPGKPYIPRSYHDYRTIRLDEKVDAKGYRYVYETVGGIVAEEVGVFQNLGLKNEGVRTQGSVEITDPVEGTTFRIDYSVVSKEAYITPRGEAPRTPPSIVKLLSLLETHK